MKRSKLDRFAPTPLAVTAFVAVSCLQLVASSVVAAQTVEQLTPHRVKLEPVDYQGKRAIKVVEDGSVANGEAYAVVKNTEFHNGTIEVEIAGRPSASAGPDARG